MSHLFSSALFDKDLCNALKKSEITLQRTDNFRHQSTIDTVKMFVMFE